MSKIHKKIIFTFLLIFYCYLCIIKIREYMNDILMNRGFIKTENPNEYGKDRAFDIHKDKCY